MIQNSKRLIFGALPLTVVSASFVSCQGPQGKQIAQKPNVILVMCDDLGWGDVGFNGNTVIQTPNIDKMAAEGVIFNRFYSACAVSSPTRASVLTGRNPYRTGVFDANAGILRTEEITLPELLKAEGYTTGHFGKWHLGTLTASEHDANRGREGNTKELNPPSLHGYDDAFVTESKVPTWDPMKKPKVKVSSTGWNALKEGEPFADYRTYYWDINGDKVTDNLEGDDSRVIMDRVIPFIERSIRSDQSFLSVVWFHTPHKPCVAGEEYAKIYSDYNQDFQNYAGCVTAMDDQMGRLRAYLEQSGIADNTIIMFCSDNGPENCSAEGGGVTGGFRERKRSLYEGGVRVPSFVYWGSNVEKPRRTDFPAVTCDYLPTIVSLVGIDPAECKHELDGVDLMPVIRGEDREREKPIVLAYKGQLSLSDNQYKLYTKRGVEEYYDIIADPLETTPLTSCPGAEQIKSLMLETLESYKMSFEGGEYGRSSYDRLEQSWKSNSNVVAE
ncbi:MAG: sulfatase-like hydrolase/transferase [Rikenellaceae bacterium]